MAVHLVRSTTLSRRHASETRISSPALIAQEYGGAGLVFAETPVIMAKLPAADASWETANACLQYARYGAVLLR